MAIHEKLGGELFDYIYGYLLSNRRQGTDDIIIQKELKRLAGKNKEKMDAFFLLEQVVYTEIMNNWMSFVSNNISVIVWQLGYLHDRSVLLKVVHIFIFHSEKWPLGSPVKLSKSQHEKESI